MDEDHVMMNRKQQKICEEITCHYRSHAVFQEISVIIMRVFNSREFKKVENAHERTGTHVTLSNSVIKSLLQKEEKLMIIQFKTQVYFINGTSGNRFKLFHTARFFFSSSNAA